MGSDYSNTINVFNTPEAAYQALTSHFNKWWTTGCNSISDVGDTITFRFGETYWIMRASKLIPNQLIELECIEAYHIHEGLSESIAREWEGTVLKWEIINEDDFTKISMVHQGLIPSLDCFEVCEQGWDHFFTGSLKQYLDTGNGFPFEV